MVDLDHCSYATIWADDKDCYRGSVWYHSLACSFFIWLLFPSTLLDLLCLFLPLRLSLFNSFISTWMFVLVSLSRPPPFLTVLFVPPPTPPQSSPLCLLISLHPSISVHWIWCCVIVSASPLGWRLSKGPQDPHSLRGLQPCQRCPLLLFSTLLTRSCQFI